MGDTLPQYIIISYFTYDIIVIKYKLITYKYCGYSLPQHQPRVHVYVLMCYCAETKKKNKFKQKTI